MANLRAFPRRSWRLVSPIALPAVLAAALAAVLVAPAGPAYAQPSLSEIEADIETAWRELEPLIEQYNKVRSELKANQAASEELAEKIEPLELQADLAADELAEIAVTQYKAGPMPALGALVTSGSPTRFVDRLTTLDQLAREQRQRIDRANEAVASYEAEKAEIDQLIEQQAEQEAELAERADAIEDDLAELERLREQAEQRLAQEQPQQPQQTQSSSGGTSDGSCPAVSSSGPGAVAAEFACSQLSKPYQWGASGPGSYDCSGLTQAAWAAAGVSLTHFTGAQWNEGRSVSRSEALPGDLVFFYGDLSHVGLYIGNGLMVDSPRAGEVVGVRSIDIMPVTGFRRPG